MGYRELGPRKRINGHTIWQCVDNNGYLYVAKDFNGCVVAVGRTSDACEKQLNNLLKSQLVKQGFAREL